jgi:hypothetical protein
MKRREFIAGLGSVAVWPLAAQGQQTERARRIGVLMLGDENDPIRGEKGWLSAFVGGGLRSWVGPMAATCGAYESAGRERERHGGRRGHQDRRAAAGGRGARRGRSAEAPARIAHRTHPRRWLKQLVPMPQRPPMIDAVSAAEPVPLDTEAE